MRHGRDLTRDEIYKGYFERDEAQPYCAVSLVTAFTFGLDSTTMDESITVMSSSSGNVHDFSEPERIGMDLEDHPPSQICGPHENDTHSSKRTGGGGAPFPQIARSKKHGLKTGFADDMESKEEGGDEGESEDEKGWTSPPSYVLQERVTYINEKRSSYQPSRSSQTEVDRPRILLDPVIVREYDYMSRDIRDFLHNYPSTRTIPTTTNQQFYSNQVPFRPGGCTIDDFHERAHGKYRTLENHHGYIQWLFPIREQGLNEYADPLQVHEARVIRADAEMQERLLKSLKLMLDFYGMELDEENTLVVVRHSDPLVCAKQYRNLCESWHNYLRITRIFKSLVELGKPDYVPSILLFILAEQAENEELNRRELRNSMDRFWVYCMRDREAQATVADAIRWVREGDGVLTMEGYRRMVERKQSEGVWKFDPVEDGLERRQKTNRGFRGIFNGRLRNK